MKNIRHILTRRNAVGKIRSVTKAMEMVSAMRFAQAHERVTAMRLYVDRLAELAGDVVIRGGHGDLLHPLLADGAAEAPHVLVVITSNRGLCGAYNSAVLKVAVDRVAQFRQAEQDVRLGVCGRKGAAFLRFRGYEVRQVGPADADWSRHLDADLPELTDMADSQIDAFTTERISGLEIAYMQFVSGGLQKPVIAQVLPLGQLPSRVRMHAPTTAEPAPYEFVPSAEDILHRLLPMAVRMRVRQCFLDAALCEHVWRRNAMRSATNSADDMIRDLTLTYHRSRQSQITAELAEIAGGQVDA